PEAGGYYVYARRAFGDLGGFFVGWTDWLTYCAVLGYVSIAMAEFLGTLSPAMSPYTRPIAAAVLVALVGLQWKGVRLGSALQEWTTLFKCAAFLGLVVAAIAWPHAAPAAAGPAAPVSFGGAIIALQAVVITYGGWQSALYFTEEDRDPAAHLPKT